ncbi:MAG: hypothetical protein CMQ38_06805 [Gammaproteobacteria bacterium]|nr:hypothetical protein [Gammaproteobacteria bacterium]|tara:strand:+ start:373322 stop:374359 length:1038 start_codon:yes stop_codon:yes gene_type:complete
MKKIIIIFSTIFAFTNPALAHHSNVGLFDTDVTIELEGTITAVSWRNPHGFIVFDVEDESGNIVQYSAETAAISVMRNRGITGDAIQVGDEVTVAGSPSSRGRNEILASNILLSSGYEFDFGTRSPYFPAGRAGNLIGYLTDDNDEELIQEAIANADGIFRTWSTIMNDRAAFPMFTGGYPLNEAGEAFLAQWDPENNELLQCGTKGTPLIMMTPFPIEFVQVGETIEMHIEEYDALRIIHMNPDAVAPEEHTQFGFSRGRWEGNTLVVETDHIQAGYFSWNGEGQSDQITVVERFMPAADYQRMDYSLSVTDPVYFTEPFELNKYFVWLPHMRVNPYECLEREY